MQRITERDLNNLLAAINTKAGHGPNPPYNTPGAYTLAGAYGGWKLEQYANTGGGVHTISTGGYVPKRELHNQMRAFLAGMASKGE